MVRLPLYYNFQDLETFHHGLLILSQIDTEDYQTNIYIDIYICLNLWIFMLLLLALMDHNYQVLDLLL